MADLTGASEMLDAIVKDELKKAAEHSRQYCLLLDQAEAAKRALETARRRAAQAHAAAKHLRERAAADQPILDNDHLDEAILRLEPRGYEAINTTTSAKLMQFDVIHPDGEKIAAVIAHDRSVHPLGEARFSVACWRTDDGSPNLPFETLDDALTYVLLQERTRFRTIYELIGAPLERRDATDAPA